MLVFDDQQYVMGLSGTAYAELDGERKDKDLYRFRPLNSVIPKFNYCV